MVVKTITSVFYIKAVNATPESRGRQIAPTLEGQLGSIESYVTSEAANLVVNHFAFYTRPSRGMVKDAVVISNVNTMPNEPVPEWPDNVVENVLMKYMGIYEPGSEKRIVKVANVESCEPKLNDYELMTMCGLLPRS